ncbi:MAG: CAP domain-containing protein [Sandaracinaceae bacterium]|nr:CAP domain-containing protein [Sandaracinaceae bacterium]
MPRTLLTAVLVLGLANVAVAQDFDADGEAAMLTQINALRAESQLAPVERLDSLDAVARAHSAEMAQTGQLAHVSDATGTPEDRVQAAGVGAARVTENVASHRDTASALAAVLASPAHRQNVLDPAVTHVGLGSARSEQGVFVTQVFAGLPAPAAAPEAPAPVEEAPAPEPVLEAGPAPAPTFELIPPFMEQAMTQAAAPVMDAVSGVLAPAAPEAPAPAVEAPPAVADAAPATPEVAAPEAAPASPAGSLSPGAANTLRELVGLAQSLLGGAN